MRYSPPSVAFGQECIYGHDKHWEAECLVLNSELDSSVQKEVCDV